MCRDLPIQPRLQVSEGVSPYMLKSLVGRGHPEFGTSRQQDACEYFLHLLDFIDRRERVEPGPGNPTECFKFQVKAEQGSGRGKGEGHMTEGECWNVTSCQGLLLLISPPSLHLPSPPPSLPFPPLLSPPSPALSSLSTLPHPSSSPSPPLPSLSLPPLPSHPSQLEECVKCVVSGKVRYSLSEERVLRLPVAMEAATNLAAYLDWEKKKAEKQSKKERMLVGGRGWE